MRKRPTADDRDDMRRLRAKGLTIEAIGARLEFSKSSVHRAVADLEVDGRIVANRARAEIPPTWLPRARRLLKRGLTRLATARKLKVSKSALYRAIDKFGR